MRIDEQGEVMWGRTWGGSPDREYCANYIILQRGKAKWHIKDNFEFFHRVLN